MRNFLALFFVLMMSGLFGQTSLHCYQNERVTCNGCDIPGQFLNGIIVNRTGQPDVVLHHPVRLGIFGNNITFRDAFQKQVTVTVGTIQTHNTITKVVNFMGGCLDSFMINISNDSIFLDNTTIKLKKGDGEILLTKSLLGLSNVDNTSDANKPISTATQTALNGKLSISNIGDGLGLKSGNLSANFGALIPLSSKTDFNQAADWGWTYVTGNTNGPNTISSQWYRGKFGLGSDYPDYFLELAFPRFNQDEANYWIRTKENDSYTPWKKLGSKWIYGFNDNHIKYNNSIGLYGATGGHIYLGGSNFDNGTYFNQGPSISSVVNPSDGNFAELGLFAYDILNGLRREVLRAASNGNVGIGTTTPYAKLHVVEGDIYNTWANNNPRFLFGSSLSAKNYGGLQWWYNANADLSTLAIGASDINGSINTMYLTPDKRIGIGISTPTGLLHIKGRSPGYGDSGIRLEQSSNSSFWDITTAYDNIYFGYNGDTKLTFGSNGNATINGNISATIPNYATRAAAAADSALPSGAMFRIDQGDGTSILHIKN